MVIDQGDWETDGLFHVREIVFQVTGRVPPLKNGVRGFLLKCLRRDGSSYYDYDYDCPEVERISCVGYKWELVRD